jgi:thioredoxin reductase
MSEHYDVVIIGGSFAGLSAGLMLGRMMQKVLIIDEGKRCNARVTESHNFLSRDGADPAKVIQEAKEQLSRYESVTLREHASVNDVAIIGDKQFQVEVSNGVVYARRVVFATGLKDIIPDIPGFAECWAISIFNCPFCHGFESKDGIVGMIDNGPMTFLFCSLQKTMSKDLTLLTNGPVAFSSDQKDILINKGVLIIEDEISAIEHVEGQIECVTFRNRNKIPFAALFVHVKTEQSCKIPEKFGNWRATEYHQS